MVILLYVGFLCAPEANVYEIEFVRFKLRDIDSGATLFEVFKPDKFVTGHGHLLILVIQYQLMYTYPLLST